MDRKQQAGGTTAPVHSTRELRVDSSVLALRWVFPNTEGPVTVLDTLRILLGRGEKCRTQLSGDDVSRYHAEICLDSSGVLIRDLQSTNGVYVNGRRISECTVSAGDVIRLGSWIGVVVAVRPKSEPLAQTFSEAAEGLFAGPVLLPVLELAKRAAVTDLPIIIEGETGTGKERVARAIHGWSGRAGPFVAINCAAVPEALAEAELFGYRKGAFTGADRASSGHFRTADGGTLLLDEIADLPLSLQAKVLRAIEQREVVPLGESRPVPVEVRILAAAQHPLQDAVRERRFRADLLARIDGVTVRLPPLRNRLEEIPYLFLSLAQRHGCRVPTIEPRVIEQLCLYDWPFNVRELDLLVRRTLALHGSEPVLRREHLPQRYHAVATESGAPQPPSTPLEHRREARSSRADDERDFAALLAALRIHHGNVTRAAAHAGISRPRAYRLIHAREGLDLEALRDGRDSDRSG